MHVKQDDSSSDKECISVTIETGYIHGIKPLLQTDNLFECGLLHVGFCKLTYTERLEQPKKYGKKYMLHNLLQGSRCNIELLIF